MFSDDQVKRMNDLIDNRMYFIRWGNKSANDLKADYSLIKEKYGVEFAKEFTETLRLAMIKQLHGLKFD